MKKLMLYLAFMIALPSVVYAGGNYMINAKDVYVVRAIDREVSVSQRSYNYQLVWNDDISKFELREGEQQRPIYIEESLPFQQEAAPQFYTKELAI